jgi:Ulp1 family protease
LHTEERTLWIPEAKELSDMDKLRVAAVFECGERGYDKDVATALVAKVRDNASCGLKDLLTLRPGEWVNDEVINRFFQLLEKRSSSHPTISARFLSTFFMSKLFCHPHEHSIDYRFDFQGVQRWFKGESLWSYGYLFIPVSICSASQATTLDAAHENRF